MNKRFKRAYIEITNVCNLSCSFCPGTKRSKRFMNLEEFTAAAEKLRPFTDYLYLHVMGEPLLHPQFEEIAKAAVNMGFILNITTNGTLIRKKADFLLALENCAPRSDISETSGDSPANRETSDDSPANREASDDSPANREASLEQIGRLRKVSISLHSFEGNKNREELLNDYLNDVWDYASRSDRVVALRLWNDGGADTLNDTIMSFLSKKTGLDVASLPYDQNGRRLSKNIYLEHADKFDWPSLNAGESGTVFCHGLSQQIAVLCDGTVVPCCLDGEGVIALGNIFSEDLESILTGKRALALTEGFINHAPSEELCRRCGYSSRFR